MKRFDWLFFLTLYYYLVVLIFSSIYFQSCEGVQQRRGFPFFYTFRPENYTFYKVRNDPNQVVPDYPTPDNMFYWLNSKNFVKFRLWTRKNPDLAHEIKFNNSKSLRTSNFDRRKQTKIIIHGFLDGASEVRIGEWILNMRDKYLALADVNVIVVDYAFYALVTTYYTARPETVGKRVSEMILFLTSQGVPLTSFHLIGWSWGAQIAGIAGHELKGRLQRITGLDPAGPGFRFLDNEFRLDKSDAQFVDVFHTNGGTRVFFGGHYGLPYALGHVDVYFNGGERQAGCPRHRTLHFGTLWCNHGRAPAYFSETILSPLAFPTCPCDNLDKYVKGECPCSEEYISYIGEHLQHSTRGIFQVITRSHKPFGLGLQMNITLPNLHFVTDDTDPSVNSRSHNLSSINETAIVTFQKLKYKISLRNSYNVNEYPNDDVLRMALLVVDKSKTFEKKSANNKTTN